MRSTRAGAEGIALNTRWAEEGEEVARGTTMSTLSEALRNLATDDPVAQMYLARAAAEIERLERERDEARAGLAEVRQDHLKLVR